MKNQLTIYLIKDTFAKTTEESNLSTLNTSINSWSLKMFTHKIDTFYLRSELFYSVICYFSCVQALINVQIKIVFGMSTNLHTKSFRLILKGLLSS